MTPASDILGERFALKRPERLWRLMTDLVKYGVASVAALAFDYGLLILFYKHYGLPYLTAAAIGFCGGLGLIYLLSVRYVFSGRRCLGTRPELLGFLVTGLIGLLLNQALMSLFVEALHLSVPLAKAPTAGCVFMFNFLSRRAMLFSPQAPTSGTRPHD
jgi:putative flippase GtrA